MEKTFFPLLVLKVGSLTVTSLWIFIPLAVTFYLFSVWKKFKGEHSPEAVISFSLNTFFSFLIIFSLARFSGGGDWSLVLGLAALFLVSLVLARSFKWNTWYVLEALVSPLIVSFWLLLIGIFLSTGKIFFLIQVLFLSIIWFLVKLLGGYRSFSWYHSGKAGFLFLAPLIALLILEGGLDFYLGNGLYWRGLLALSLAFALGVVLFLRSKK